MRGATLTLVAAGTFVVLQATPCLACSCAATTEAGILDRADVVFTGVAVEDTPVFFSIDEVPVRFVVESVRKGAPLGPVVSIFTRNQSTACGIQFTQGARYVIYASEWNGRLATSSCSGTRPDGSDYRAVMHPSYGPVGPLPAEADVPLAIAVGVAGLSGGIATVAWRRRRAAG